MKKILVVVDMQKDCVDGSLGTPEAQAIVPNVVNKIKEFEGDIFVTLDTHEEDYLHTPEGAKLPVRHCIRGSEGWKLDKNVAEVLEDREYEKVYKETFGSVFLPDLIYENMRKNEDPNELYHIELIGLCTDICVVSNALLLKANYPEHKISVDATCCAGVTPETHNHALSVMRMCQIDIIE